MRPSIRTKTAARRELDFAIEELQFRRDMLADMAPKTDAYERMMWRVQALDRAIALLNRPYFEVSPLV